MKYWTLSDQELEDQLIAAGFIPNEGPTCAFDIIEQMPVGTSLSTLESMSGEPLWECTFEEGFMTDGRQDECPHVAAAKAFITWKEGLI